MDMTGVLAGPFENCVEVASGTFVDLLDPQPDTISISDIAQHLGAQCRFTGAVRPWYSVAEHSVNVHDLIFSKYGPGELAFAGLMHDAAEAYLGDQSRPLKAHDTVYQEFEARLERVIRERFGIEWNDHVAAVVRWADNMALRAEFYQLMPSRGDHVDWGDVPLRPITLRCFGPDAASRMFLYQFAQYRLI